jgi:hypothetical protein
MWLGQTLQSGVGNATSALPTNRYTDELLAAASRRAARS